MKLTRLTKLLFILLIGILFSRCQQTIFASFLGLFFFLNVANAQQKIEKWSPSELVLNHPNPEESFSKVQLSARFYKNDTSFVVPGIYDGDNQYKICFMPNETGKWSYTTSRNILALNKKKGSFEVVEASGNYKLRVKLLKIT